MKKTGAMLALIAVLTVTTPGAARADLDAEMNDIFNGLVQSNTSSPAVIANTERGVVSGGSITAHAKIMTINPLSVVPPSFNAGCGGIDMFAGSFSFVNADQFVQMLRTVASNAAGLSFKMALNAMCPDCAQQLTTLAQRINSLNQLLHNSCKAASELLNAANVNQANMNEWLQNPISQKLQEANSAVSDAFGAWFPTQGGNASTSGAALLNSADPAAMTRLSGNIIWRILYNQQVSQWFSAMVPNDTTLMEQIMSMFGTVVVNPANKDPSTGNITPQEIPPTIGLKELLEGDGTSNTVTLLMCDDTSSADTCLGVSPVPNQPLTSFEDRVKAELLGNIDKGGNDPGLIARISAKTETPADASFLNAIGSGWSGKIALLARYDQNRATAWAQEAYKRIALDMVLNLVDQAQRAVVTAMAAAGGQEGASTSVVLFSKMMQAAETHIAQDRAALLAKYPSEYALAGELHFYLKDITLHDGRGSDLSAAHRQGGI